MKLKGTMKLANHMDKFLRPFGVTSFLGKEFAYHPVTEEVQFTVFMTERIDRLFAKFISDTFNYKVTDMFLISILHEVGHHVTLDDFEDEELNDEWKRKSRIEWELDDSNYDEKMMEYFNLPSERAATAWAVSYMRAHEEEINRRWRVMLQHFRHFYKRNFVR